MKVKRILLGIYLSPVLVDRLRIYVSKFFLRYKKKITESSIVEEALTEYLDKREGK